MPNETDRPPAPGIPSIGPEDFKNFPRWDRVIPDFSKPNARFVAIPGSSGSSTTFVRSGFVRAYRLELHPMKMGNSTQPLPFFRMTLVDNAPGAPGSDVNPEEFVLVRNWTIPGVDLDANSNQPTVTYGNVEQAIVATAKDAMLHGKAVTVIWQYPVNSAFDDVDTSGPKIITVLQISR